MIPKTLRLRLLLGGAALLVVGLATGWLMADDGPDTTKAAAAADAWQEPALRNPDTAKALASLTKHSLWGDGGPAAVVEAAKPASADWRLSGIVIDNGPPRALILVTESGKPGGHVQDSKTGDDLPDGSHIVAISKTTITVAGDSGQREVKLFSPN